MAAKMPYVSPIQDALSLRALLGDDACATVENYF